MGGELEELVDRHSLGKQDPSSMEMGKGRVKEGTQKMKGEYKLGATRGEVLLRRLSSTKAREKQETKQNESIHADGLGTLNKKRS